MADSYSRYGDYFFSNGSLSSEEIAVRKLAMTFVESFCRFSSTNIPISPDENPKIPRSGCQVKKVIRGDVEAGKYGNAVQVKWIPGKKPTLVLYDEHNREVWYHLRVYVRNHRVRVYFTEEKQLALW